MFDYKLFEAFAAVVSEGGFDRAAKKLFITQSAISQRVKMLEDQTGSVLLIRSQPPEPTAQGIHILKHFQKVNHLERELFDDLNLKNSKIRSISIGINADSLATWFLNSVSDVLHKNCITLDIYVDDQDETKRLLKEGVVSGCISSDNSSFQGCSTHFVGKMEYKMACSKEFKDKYFEGGFTPDLIEKAPAVVFNRKDELHKKFIVKHFGEVPEFISHYVPSSESFADFIKKGLGYGMVPYIQCIDQFKDGSLIELMPEGKYFVELYWHSWNLKSKTLDELTRAIKKADIY